MSDWAEPLLLVRKHLKQAEEEARMIGPGAEHRRASAIEELQAAAHHLAKMRSAIRGGA